MFDLNLIGVIEDVQKMNKEEKRTKNIPADPEMETKNNKQQQKPKPKLHDDPEIVDILKEAEFLLGIIADWKRFSEKTGVGKRIVQLYNKIKEKNENIK